jgi:hypothetical protein
MPVPDTIVTSGGISATAVLPLAAVADADLRLMCTENHDRCHAYSLTIARGEIDAETYQQMLERLQAPYPAESTGSGTQ